MFTMKQEFPLVLKDLFHMAKSSFQKHILIKLDMISEMELQLSHKEGAGLQQSFMSKMNLNLLSNVKTHIM
jgi:hypothetical protein